MIEYKSKINEDINPSKWGILAGGDIEIAQLPLSKYYVLCLMPEKITLVIGEDDIKNNFVDTMTKYCKIAKEIRGLI